MTGHFLDCVDGMSLIADVEGKVEDSDPVALEADWIVSVTEGRRN